MGVCIFAISFSLSLIISVSASANITSSTGEDVCIGDNAIYVCSVTGSSLNWAYEGSIAVYSASLTNSQTLDPFQTESVSVCDGVLMSSATVNVTQSIANTVNGTTIFCDNTSTTASFTINIRESAPISYLMIQLVQENIMLHWGGAQCVLHYIVEVDNGNGVTVNSTTDASSSYPIPNEETMFIFTVHGVNYTGNIFTTVFQTFSVTGPDCSARNILADNGTLYIVIESENFNQLPISNCTLTFNSTICNCSENRVIDFEVPPGEYAYIIVMSNAVDSTVCANDTATVSMAPSPTTTPTSTTVTVIELPPVAIGVITILAGLLIAAVLMNIVFTYITWRLRSSKGRSKRVNTTNLRTTSPDQKFMMSSEEKDMSKM